SPRASERSSAPAVAPSAPAPADPQLSSTNRMKAAGDGKDAKDVQRKRAKMTLRIPDDEVARPQPPSAMTPVAGVPAVGAQPPPKRPPSMPDDVTTPMMQAPMLPSLTGPPPPDEDVIGDISADDTLELPERDPRRLGAV